MYFKAVQMVIMGPLEFMSMSHFTKLRNTPLSYATQMLVTPHPCVKVHHISVSYITHHLANTTSHNFIVVHCCQIPVVLSTFTFDFSVPGLGLPVLSTSTTTGAATAGKKYIKIIILTLSFRPLPASHPFFIKAWGCPC
jgi:hypothetical protein